jgi:hypothetical protein
MRLASLTFKEIKARPVICKLTRPAVARIGAMTHLPIILIDLFTEEGVVGRSYLKPYLPKSMKYLIPALLDFGEMLKGRRVSPVDLYETARKSLHFVGYISGIVDDRRGRPRHGGLGRVGQSGRRASVRSARWLGRARECLQHQRAVAAVAGIRGSRGGRTARREGRRIPSTEASAGPRRSTRRPRDHKGSAGCDRRRHRPNGRF